MKYLSVLSLFLLLLSPRGQSQTMAKIELSAGDCRAKETYPRTFRDTIRFYKIPENTLAFSVILRKYRSFPIKLDSIHVGDYTLRCRNTFRQEIVLPVSIHEQEINHIAVCFDKLLSYPQNTLLKLRNKDTISINFHSIGCFNNDIMKIVIKKEAGKLVAQLYKAPWLDTIKNGTPDRYRAGIALVKTTTMTEANMNDFTRFENELNFSMDGGCTTTDFYNIKSPYLNIKATDGTCHWNGFYYLRKSIFGEKE